MDEPSRSRRGFLGFLTVVVGGIPVLGGAFAALRALLAPARTDRPARIPLCRLGEVPEQGILERALSYRVRRGPLVESVSKVVFVTRDPGTREVIALSGECTHLACPVHVGRGEGDAPLMCPCHGGRFSATGEVLDGPPPAPLRRLTLALPEGDDGMIEVVAG